MKTSNTNLMCEERTTSIRKDEIKSVIKIEKAIKQNQTKLNKIRRCDSDSHSQINVQYGPTSLN